MRLLKLLGAASCLLALNLPLHAVTLTGADIQAAATFPSFPPTLNGTSLVFGPAAGAYAYPKQMALPVSQYMDGNKLEITFNMTRLPCLCAANEDSNPIFGVSDGTHVIVLAAGEDSNGALSTAAMVDQGLYGEFIYAILLADQAGYPAFGQPYSFKVTLEFSPAGVLAKGSMSATNVSYQHNIPLNTANLQLVLFHDNDSGEQYQLDSLAIGGAARPVAVDVKPASCPNPISLAKQGVLPVAVNGTASLAASAINPATVRLAGVAPLRHALEDVATPYEPVTGKGSRSACTLAGADGVVDLSLKFDAQAVLDAVGPHTAGDVVTLPLTGRLYDGTAIIGEDVVWIRP